MRSRWVLYQEATADDLTSIKGSCVGDTRSLLLPLGWRAAVRPDDLDFDAHAGPASSWTDTDEYRGEIRSDAEKILKQLTELK